MLVHWFLKCWCHLLFDHFQFTLIHGPNIPSYYAILLFTASDFASITNHIHNWVLVFFGSMPSFFLELFLYWSLVAYLGTYPAAEFIFQCPIFLPFHTVHGVLKARILKWFAIPFSRALILSDLSTMTRPSWVAPRGMAWFHWVRQGCGPCDQIG